MRERAVAGTCGHQQLPPVPLMGTVILLTSGLIVVIPCPMDVLSQSLNTGLSCASSCPETLLLHVANVTTIPALQVVLVVLEEEHFQEYFHIFPLNNGCTCTAECLSCQLSCLSCQGAKTEILSEGSEILSACLHFIRMSKLFLESCFPLLPHLGCDGGGYIIRSIVKRHLIPLSLCMLVFSNFLKFTMQLKMLQSMVSLSELNGLSMMILPGLLEDHRLPQVLRG
ncbi:hypothetical protein E2C01_038818 [Portunus trituberculatus]|uniref:Uncharacterized protein n=1 Tax=Portunus trituberculatus TaxID=210409 RepID=A0A5B7FJ19_PORTR|nr:hypothetical protein [Portunus trituberculatus]